LNINSKKRPIVFYFPYSSVGGVSVLFLRLARLLRNERKVILMDLEDGYMVRNIPSGVEFIPYTKPEELPNDSIVIFQSVPPWRISFISQFPLTANIFYWNLHPDNLRPDFIGIISRFKRVTMLNYLFSAIRKRKLNKLLKLLLNKNAIRFMDQENYLATAFIYGLKVNNPKYLQILTDNNNEAKIKNRLKKGKTINLAWLGRIDDFKTPILMHIIKRLCDIQTFDVNFSIIGTGGDIEKVRELSQQQKNIVFSFISEIPPDNMQKAFENIDILFAMGTSALDGAKNKVPTILVDYSYKKINGLYQFKMIYEKQNYNMGELINISHMEKMSSLENLIRSIVDDFEEYSEKSFLYWKRNFSPEEVLPKFISAIEDSSMTINNIINNNIHKPDIFTVLKQVVKDVIKPGSNDKGWIYS